MRLLSALPQETVPHITYRIALKPDTNGPFSVQMTIDNPQGDKTDVAIPAWTPGYYQILHYEKDVSRVRAATGDNRPLAVTRPDNRTWEIATPAGTKQITLTYDVTPTERGLGFFGNRADSGSGYVNGASVFLYLVGHTDAPCRLETRLSASLVTTLDPAPAADAPETEHDFQAAGYDELIDCPIQFGAFKTMNFDVDGTPFQCVIVGNTQSSTAKLTASLTRIARAAKSVFGSFPFPRYTFFFHVGGAGFEGGLEHRRSTVIHIQQPVGDGSSGEFIPLVTHEFFHAWNVKQLHPAGLGPFDYTKEVRSPSLWFAEGVTDYYSEILPVRGGQEDKNWFLKEMAGRIEELDSVVSRRAVTLEEASRKAWEGESEGFDGLSYYLKGSLVGLYFDLRIRELTHGAASLDNVLRELEAQYGQKNRAYPDEAIRTALSKIAQSDLSAEYDKYVRGTEDIAWEDVFDKAGLTLRREKKSFLGLRTSASRQRETGGLPVVQTVLPGFAAEAMGLQKGDIILSVNGQRTEYEAFTKTVRAIGVGKELILIVQRGAERKTLHGAVGFQYGKAALTEMEAAKRTPEAARLLRDYFKPLLPPVERDAEKGIL